MFAEYDTPFRLNSETVCPGDILSFQCTVTGGHATVWQGSAFDCANSNNEIQFGHNQFNNTSTKSCNDGIIVGQSLYIEDNNYTSQLTITITTNMTGKTIQCAHDDGTSEKFIGNYTINYSKDSVCANLNGLNGGTSEPTPIVTGTRITSIHALKYSICI